MVYPGAGIANSTGSAWGTSYGTTGAGTSVVLSDSPTITGTVTFGGTAVTAAAWSTNGIGIKQAVTTYTDNTTAASGTVVNAYMNVWGQQNYAASNTGVTVTNLYGHYFNAPAAGANVTATNVYGVVTEGLYVNSGGDFITSGGATNTQIATNQTTGIALIGSTSATGTITLGRSTASQTTNIQAGPTASTFTKTINLGTGGASGSTTNIAIGSAIGGATSTTTLNGTVSLQNPLSVGSGGTGLSTLFAVTTQSTSYSETATFGDRVVLITGSAVNVTLPTAVGNTARFNFKLTVAGTMTLTASGAQTIDGGATASTSVRYTSITIVSDNANWQVI
jgi:hypothetical protein